MLEVEVQGPFNDGRRRRNPIGGSRVRAGPFDPDTIDVAEAGEPRQQLPVTRSRGRERRGGEDPSDDVDDRGDMDIFVGVDPAGDNPVCLSHSDRSTNQWRGNKASHTVGQTRPRSGGPSIMSVTRAH